MLIYHFGSKEGLLIAVIRSVEAAQREFSHTLLKQPELPPGDGVRLMSRHFIDPLFAPHERLCFEIYAQALQSRPGTTGLLDDVVGAWTELGAELSNSFVSMSAPASGPFARSLATLPQKLRTYELGAGAHIL
jgi:AcrR family transcriptional regulator